MADENKRPKMARPGLSEQQDRKKQDKKKQGPMGGLGNLPGKNKKEKPSMIIKTGVPEGPAKQNTTIKTFKIYPKDIDGQNIKIKKFAKGGMVTVSGRGQGKVMSGRNKKTYIC